MKLLTFFLIIFSAVCFNIDGRKLQVPAKPKSAVTTSKTANSTAAKGKSKAKKVKKVVIKKDTLPEIDPANANSPLYEKN